MTVQVVIIITGQGANVEMEGSAGLDPKLIAAIHQILTLFFTGGELLHFAVLNAVIASQAMSVYCVINVVMGLYVGQDGKHSVDAEPLLPWLSCKH